MEVIEGFRTLIAGISRMGKSFYVKKEVIPELVNFKPVIIFDRKQEYSGNFTRDADPAWIGYDGANHFFKSLDEAGVVSKKVHVIKCSNDVDYIAPLRFFIKLRKPVSLVIDEGHDIFLDKDLYQAKSSVVKAVRYGASEGIDVIFISQRTYDMPPDIRSQFEGIISFKQRHPDDVKAVDGMGFTGADKLLDLERRQKIVFGDFPEHLSFYNHEKS